MKLISDGSLNTRSAYCSTPYSGIDAADLRHAELHAASKSKTYMRLATEHGFDIACHAIGDEANTIALNAVGTPRTHTDRIEHAQMLKTRRYPAFRASWGSPPASSHSTPWTTATSSHDSGPIPAGIPYRVQRLCTTSGTTLRMGSDAPVAPLDPWLAISAAVFGTESSDREPLPV